MDAHLEVTTPETAEDFAQQLIEDEIVNWITGRDGVVAIAFSAHGYPNPWAALKPATIKDKVRKGYSPQADQTRTGKLQTDALNPAITREPGALTFTIPAGTNPYAAAHQYGSMGTQTRQYHATLKAIRRRRSTRNVVRAEVSIGQQMPARPPLPAPSPEWCAHFAQELVGKLLKLEGF